VALGSFVSQAALSSTDSAVIAKASAGKRDWAGFETTAGYRDALAEPTVRGQINALEKAYSEWSSTKVAHVGSSLAVGAPAAKEKAEAMGVAVARNADAVAAILANTAARKKMVEAIVQNPDARAHIASKEMLVRELVKEVRVPAPPVAPVVFRSPLKIALATRQHTALIEEINRQLAAGEPLHGDAAAVAGEVVGGAGHLKTALATHQHAALIAALLPAHHGEMINALGGAHFVPMRTAVLDNAGAHNDTAHAIATHADMLRALATTKKLELINDMAAQDARDTVRVVLENPALQAELRARIDAVEVNGARWTAPADLAAGRVTPA